MEAFLADHPVRFSVLHDAAQRLVADAGIEAMPSSFLVDRSGRIVAMHKGFRAGETKEQLAAEIESLLKGATP